MALPALLFSLRQQSIADCRLPILAVRRGGAPMPVKYWRLDCATWRAACSEIGNVQTSSGGCDFHSRDQISELAARPIPRVFGVAFLHSSVP